MFQLCKRIADSESFQSFILSILILTAISMGLEAVPDLEEQFGDLFYVTYLASQAIFCFEILIRILAHSPNFRKFFYDSWNKFDFIVVILSVVPLGLGFVNIARLLRVIRVLRIFSSSIRIKRFLDQLRHSIDELFYALVIIFIVSYIFGISGYYLFSEIAGEHWGSLDKSMLSVFYLLLFQKIPQMVESAISASFLNIVYFVIFYICYFCFCISVIGAICGEYANTSNNIKENK